MNFHEIWRIDKLYGLRKSLLNFEIDPERTLHNLSHSRMVQFLIDAKSESEVWKTIYGAVRKILGLYRCRPTCCWPVITMSRFQRGVHGGMRTTEYSLVSTATAKAVASILK